MNPHPAFVVRSYPAFRAARLYRVLVSPTTLYFIRMKGLISASDAGSAFDFRPDHAAVAALIRWFGQKTIDSARAETEQVDPEEMVRTSKKHFKLSVDEFVNSSLEPPSLFSGHGHYYASWKIVTHDRKDRFQIEDPESLESALMSLPAVLGPKLTVKVDRPYGGDRFRSRIMG
jgi:hypothetical protein